MSERFEDRLWQALESTVPSIPQQSQPRGRNDGPKRFRSLAVAAAIVVIAGVTWEAAKSERTTDVSVTPTTQRDVGQGDDSYLTFDLSQSPHRDRTPQFTVEEQRRADQSQQHFVERGTDRNRASLVVGEMIPAQAGTADLTSPAGMPVSVTLRSRFADHAPLQAAWDLGGRRWFVTNGERAQGQRLLGDRELLGFIDSLQIEGGRLVSDDEGFVETPPVMRRRVWAVSTPSGASLSADRWETADLSGVPGNEVQVRGTTGVITRGSWSAAVGGDTEAALRWVEDGMVMTLSLPSLPEPENAPPSDAELVRSADSLLSLSKARFESLPFDPAIGWGSDGELVISVPDVATWAGDSLSINTLQRKADGTTIHGSKLGIGLSRDSQPWLPNSIAVRAAADAAEILVWTGDGPDAPACAQVVPVRSGQPAKVITLDLTCVS
jgi:hypothetical protein